MTKKEKLAQYYRWQFLRLNKEYRLQYDLFSKGIDFMKKNSKYSEVDKQEKIAKISNELYKKHGINGMYDYRTKKLHQALRIYGKTDIPVQKGCLMSLFGDKLAENQDIRGNLLLETRIRPKDTKKRKVKKVRREAPLITPKYVQVVINYDAKLGDIRREINRIVKGNRKVRRDELSIKRGKASSRFSSKDYDNILRVWKLRTKGMQNKDVAKKIFPKQKENIRAAEDKVCGYYTDALNLINGGYRNITF